MEVTLIYPEQPPVDISISEPDITIETGAPEAPAITIVSGVGPQGPRGPKGDPGETYILTQEDKLEIRDMTTDKVVETLIDDQTIASDKVWSSEKAKDYVDDAISQINTMELHICVEGEYNPVTGLPTISEPSEQTFYLVPGGDEPNLYIERIYLENRWEQFGSATIDLSNYVTFDDYATSAKAGIVKVNGTFGTQMISQLNAIGISRATDAGVKAGNDSYKPVTPVVQHAATFYGLTKAAGVDMKDSNNNVGTYTAEAQEAIKSMLGVKEGLKVVRLI